MQTDHSIRTNGSDRLARLVSLCVDPIAYTGHLDIIHPSSEELRVGARILASICGDVDGDRQFLEAVQRTFWGERTYENAAPFAPDEVAEAIAALRPAFARQLGSLALIFCAIDPSTASSKYALAGPIARACGVDPRSRYYAMLACNGQGSRLGREHAAAMEAGHDAIAAEPWRAVRSDPASWVALPDGSLGRELVLFRESQSIPSSKARSWKDEWMIRHDMIHLVGGYETSPQDEVAVCAFTAGSIANGGEFALLSTLLLFNLGVKLAIVAEPSLGVMQEPGMSERFFAAARRGATVQQDLAHCWNFHDQLAQPLEYVRGTLGLGAAAPA